MVILCLACACHGKRVLNRREFATHSESVKQALATLLAASTADAAFQALGSNGRLRFPLQHQRHAQPLSAEITFKARSEVASPPFSLGSKPVGDFFAEEDALRVLMSQADSSQRLDHGESKNQQRWEVFTNVPFPGTVAKSATTMNVNIDTQTPQLKLSSSQSRTVCEGGPAWARSILARVMDIATTTTNNQVEIRQAPGGKVFVSKVDFSLSLNLPPLPIPVGVVESMGSDAVQKFFDRLMPVTLTNLREAYLRWAA